MKVTSYSDKLLVLILIATFAISCAKKEAAPQAEQTAAENKGNLILDNPDTDDMGRVPPDEPVWAEGETFTVESMKNTVVQRTRNLDLIYLSYKQKFPELAGVVTMHFIINPDGSVINVEVTNSDWNEMTAYDINQHMIDEVSNWTFPPGLDKPTGVTQPWKFKE